MHWLSILHTCCYVLGLHKLFIQYSLYMHLNIKSFAWVILLNQFDCKSTLLLVGLKISLFLKLLGFYSPLKFEIMKTFQTQSFCGKSLFQLWEEWPSSDPVSFQWPSNQIKKCSNYYQVCETAPLTDTVTQSWLWYS